MVATSPMITPKICSVAVLITKPSVKRRADRVGYLEAMRVTRGSRRNNTSAAIGHGGGRLMNT